MNASKNKNGYKDVWYLIQLLYHNLQGQVSMELSARYHLEELC